MIAKTSIVGIGQTIIKGPGKLMESNAMVTWIIRMKPTAGLSAVLRTLIFTLTSNLMVFAWRHLMVRIIINAP